MVAPGLLTSPMARKNPHENKHASELRWGDWTPAELVEAAKAIQEQAGYLEALADSITKAGVKRLRVDGDKKYTQAVKLLRAFGGNVQKALINAQTRN